MSTARRGQNLRRRTAGPPPRRAWATAAASQDLARWIRWHACGAETGRPVYLRQLAPGTDPTPTAGRPAGRRRAIAVRVPRSTDAAIKHHQRDKIFLIFELTPMQIDRLFSCLVFGEKKAIQGTEIECGMVVTGRMIDL
jgi:hypothetical protein